MTRHVHRCPECYETKPCDEACATPHEPLEDGTPVGDIWACKDCDDRLGLNGHQDLEAALAFREEDQKRCPPGSEPCDRCGGTGVEPWVLLTHALIPVKTVSEANIVGEARAKMARKKAQREVVDLHLRALFGIDLGKRMVAHWGHVHVALTRYHRPGKVLDDDNLAGSQKMVRDCVARYLGVDDGNTAVVSWDVKQKESDGKMGTVVAFYRRR